MSEEIDDRELGARVAEARALAALTQEELASRTRMERTVISKIENGARRLGATELVAIADALERPVDWFFKTSPPAVISRRADPSVGGRSRILDTKVERIARDIEFLRDQDELPSLELFLRDPPGSLGEAEQAALDLRKHLQCPQGPLIALQGQVERVGLYGFSIDLGRSGPDAAYVAVEDVGVAVINGALEPGRRRFNLAHELGHHVFQDAYAPEIGLSPQDENEKLINAFAIHLLLPSSDVHLIMKEFDPDYRLGAVAAAVRYRLSWTAVCAQLRNVGVIDAGIREELANRPPSSVDFLELGEHWVPELDAPSVPPQYGRRVLAAYRRGKLTSSRVQELLWGTLRDSELPTRDEVPVEAFRPEFEPLR